jgi:hypothetical protein
MMFDSNVLNRIEQVDAMRMGVDYRLKISCRKFEVLVRPLTIMETMQVAANVVEKMKTMPESWKNRMTEHMFTAREMIKYASTSDVGKNDSVISDVMLDALTNDELQFVYRQYVAATDKVNPCLEQMADTELQLLVEDIKKNYKEVSASALTELTFLQAINLVRYFLTHGE